MAGTAGKIPSLVLALPTYVLMIYLRISCLFGELVCFLFFKIRILLCGFCCLFSCTSPGMIQLMRSVFSGKGGGDGPQQSFRL